MFIVLNRAVRDGDADHNGLVLEIAPHGVRDRSLHGKGLVLPDKHGLSAEEDLRLALYDAIL